ncbi:MAG: tripartite tricarboxylate transporter permease, partial [Halobacteriota archaeon]|nr:tripartite tricarboxylate transporter permease [Halobacteriota archaeon]
MDDISLLILIVSILLGYLLGLISGLTPGIHTNNFALLLVAASQVFIDYGFSPLYVAVIIISNSITHTFLDIIPSIFLGAPDADTALAVLPGHRLLLQGRGIEAIRLSAIGSFGSVIASILLLIPAIFLFRGYYIIQGYIGFILLLIAFIMILSETGERIEGQGSLAHLKFKGYATLIFVLSGLLGLLSFEREFMIESPIGLPNPSVLFPLFSGLFGAPLLIQSILSKAVIPEQMKGDFHLTRYRVFRGIVTGTMAGAIVSFLPGVSSAIGTLLTRLFIRDDLTIDSQREFLVSLSGVNTANSIFCLVVLYVIGRTRSGAMIAVNEIYDAALWDGNTLLLFIIVILFVSTISYFSTVFTGERASLILPFINYQVVCVLVLIVITVTVILFSGWFGLILLLTSVPLGLMPTYAKVRRSHLMGVLMLP